MSASGTRRPRMADVAARAGVGIGTVSNVLNRPELVAPATRARVEQAVRDLGFVPDGRARDLARGRSAMVGFVVFDLSNSFFLDMARGAEEAASARGLSLLLADAARSRDKQRHYVDWFDQERAAGILLAPSPRDDEDIAAAGEWSRPVVLLNADHGPARCRVSVDDELGGYLAARHLIDAGCRRLLLAGGPMSLTPLARRRQGVRRAVAESRRTVELEHVETAGVRVEHGAEVGVVLADRPPERRPDGVVAAADLLALGLVTTLLDRGIRVGRDVAVVGHDDNKEAWSSPVALTTVRQPGPEMGRVALDLLDAELQEGPDHAHAHVVLRPELVVRSSTA